MENPTESFVLVSTGTFECPIESDGTLLLSTLQGLIPHANGLSYVSADTNRTRVIRYDKRVGKLYSPSDGWGQRIYTVSFSNIGAYGCMRSPLAMDRYDRATRTFRDSVDAVERLFDISYESETQSESKAVERLKQEIARLRTKNKELETDKRRLELELEEKDKKILALLTEVPGPESLDEDTNLATQATKSIHDKENLERERLKNQLEAYHAHYASTPDSEIATVRSVGAVAQASPSPQEKEEHQQENTDWLENQWNQAKVRIEELEKELKQREGALAAAEAARKALQQELSTLAEEAKNVNALGQSQASQDTTIEDQKREIADLQRQLTESNEKVHALQGQLETSESWSHKFKSELDEVKKASEDHAYRMSEMQASLSWKEAETTTMKKGFDEMDAKLKKKDEELELFRRKYFQLESAIEMLRNQNREAQTPTGEDTSPRWQYEYCGWKSNGSAADESPEAKDEIMRLKQKILDLEEQLHGSNYALGNLADDGDIAVTMVQGLRAAPPSTESTDQPSSGNSKLKQMETELKRLRENETKLNDALVAAKRELEDSRWRRGELESMVMGGTLTSAGLSGTHLEESKGKIAELMKEIKRLQKLYDEALWRISKTEGDLGNETKQLQDARSYIQDLQNEINGKSDQLRDTWNRIHELEGRLNEIEARHPYLVQNGVVSEESAVVHINREYEKVRGQLGDAGNHIRWLEEQLNHYKHLFHDTSARLNHLQGVLDSAHRHLWDAFVIRKESFVDRHRWKLSMWSEGSDEHYVRIWYELDAPKAKQVYIATSYYNWECLLLMSWHEHQKWGVWVDAPKGRHEFRFLVDGEWKTGDNYPICYNDYGSQNNWREMQ